MTDLIKREDALECFMGFDRMGDVKDAIAALPAVVPSVKPLVWLQQYNAIGEPTNFWQAADPVLSVCWHANPTRPKEVVEATRSDRILAVLELVAAPDPAATREAALQARIEERVKERDELGRKLNTARYGQPDFAWSIHEEAMADLRAKLTKALDEREQALKSCEQTLDERDEALAKLTKAMEALRGILKGDDLYPWRMARAVLAELGGK